MAIVTRYFGVRTVTSGSISIVFEADDDTMTRASGSFITDGFQVGDIVTVSGTTNNNGDKVITNVAQLVLTSSTALTDETDATTTIALKTGDGTTWAKRAALFDGSNTWSDVIAAFNFSGSDSLLALIGPGTYTCAESLAAAVFSVAAPTVVNPLILHGCDSSGVALTPPDPDWVSAQPSWGSSGLPVIATTSNITTFNLANMYARLLKVTSSGRNGGFILAGNTFDWCHIVNSSAGSGVLVGGVAFTNCIIDLSGSSQYSYAVTAAGLDGKIPVNNRIIGNPGASTGTGMIIASNTDVVAINNTVIKHPTAGIGFNGSGTSGVIAAIRCIIVDNVGPGILLRSDSAQTQNSEILGCYIANNGYGIDANTNAAVIVTGCRLRDNTSGNFANMGNMPTGLGNDESAGDDTEFANYAGGDYRISASSAMWGKGYGAGDEIPTAAEIATAVWARSGRSLTA